MAFAAKLKSYWYYVHGRPIAINTWEFPETAEAAMKVLEKNPAGAVDAVVEGCTVCERAGHRSVGPGGNFDENGEVTQDAMVMDGSSLRVGAVAGLRRVSEVTRVARAVMDFTKHSLLVGDLATQFAVEMGFEEKDISSEKSKEEWKEWKNNGCNPNWRQNVRSIDGSGCGPYRPKKPNEKLHGAIEHNKTIASNPEDHDTVGLLVLDEDGNVAAACSTSGRVHKVPGRVGDTPLVGCGAYADSKVGAAACTGDGDVMMMFCPAFDAVKNMEKGFDPVTAAEGTIMRMTSRLSAVGQKYSGAVIALDKTGRVGAACHGMESFKFCVATRKHQKIYSTKCI